MPPLCICHSPCAIIELIHKAVGPWRVDVEEEGEVHHHSQGEQESLHREADPDKHNHSQHSQQAAVQVVLDGERNIG